MTRKKYAVCNVKYPVKDTLPIKYLNLNYVLSKQIGSAGICYDWASFCLLFIYFFNCNFLAMHPI